jgi:nuclease HARBI1
VIGDTCDLSQSSLHRIISRISSFLANKLNEYVKFPSSEEKKVQKQLFYNIAGFPVIVGCVDGTHIRIKRPQEDHVQYFNRKCYNSINIMGICNAQRQFTYVSIQPSQKNWD